MLVQRFISVALAYSEFRESREFNSYDIHKKIPHGEYSTGEITELTIFLTANF